jgi:hypothetical protein
VVVLNEVCAIVTEIALMKVGIFELVYLQVPRSCLGELRVLLVSRYNLARHDSITTA